MTEHWDTPYPEIASETRIGALRYELGFPTPETTQKLFDEMDFQRAVQAYLWGISGRVVRVHPAHGQAGSGHGLQRSGHRRQLRRPAVRWLTANDTTIYAFVNIDLAQGPVVIEIPPGAIVGLMDDFWQRSLADVGLPGRRGKGGKFLLLPPGYDGEVPPSGYYVLRPRCTTTTFWSAASSSTTSARRRRARPEGQGLPVERARRSRAEQVRLDLGQADRYDSPGGIEYWARLATVIYNNPVQEHDRFFMAMLKPLGIEKGKPFEPDSRQPAILEEAAALGDAMARNVMYEGSQRISGATAFRARTGTG